eukprot:TRINITY_DN7209_c0_g1_i1.p1 TRINITY_DN7209_c0_g1~~TRINITY_DN7209_c0_g1_i1.p1  ORF type:complete len:117 (-),score=21.51 TRINITY_DN7209_c0_g1_i1:131-481(-)
MIEKLKNVNYDIKRITTYLVKNVSLDTVKETLSSLVEASNILNDLEPIISGSRGLKEELAPISKIGINKNEKEPLNVISTTLPPQNIDNIKGKQPLTSISPKLQIQKFTFDVAKLK